MPKYQDDILEVRLAKFEKCQALIQTGRLSATVGWPISGLKNKLKRNLELAEIGVHEFIGNICNCGLIAPRFKKTGHRNHVSKGLVGLQFRLVIVVGEQSDY
jgi:hypothetical protein